jgi:hypothetical protein
MTTTNPDEADAVTYAVYLPELVGAAGGVAAAALQVRPHPLSPSLVPRTCAGACC